MGAIEQKPIEILVLKAKHGDQYYQYNTIEQKRNSAVKIFENNRDNYNFPTQDLEKARLIDDMRGEEKRKAAFDFIWKRSDEGYEYEELSTDNAY